MLRSLAALVLTASGMSLLTAAVLPAPADAARPATCGGKRVTIDLNRADHPDPERPRADVVLGTPSTEWINTGRGDDIVCGGRGLDRIDLGPGDDKAYGQGGGDLLWGGPGRDRLVGGRHSDRAMYRGAPRAVKVDLGITGPQATGWGRDTLVDMEQVSGSAYDDVLQTASPVARAFGGPGDDVLLGSDGEDDLVGGPGADHLDGGPGDDAFESLSDRSVLGEDVASGGAGDDVFFGATLGDAYDGGADNDLFYSADCSPCGSQVVELVGGAGDDAFNLEYADEVVVGGPGSDQIEYFLLQPPPGEDDVLTVDLAVVGPQDTGAGGTDDLAQIEDVYGDFGRANHLSGDDGPNRLTGRDGGDVLIGRGGDDTLDGSEGTDTCDGGTGTNELIACEL